MAATKEVVWNEISSSTIPELVIGQVTRSLLGATGGVYVKVPGRAGAWYSPNARGLRQIRMECHLIDRDNDFQGRRDLVTEVADWLDVEAEAKLTISDAPGVFYWATLGDPPDPNEWREAAVFELIWNVQPYSYDVTISEENWTSDIDDNHVWNPNLLAPSYPVITIQPTNGTLTSFTLETNGDTLTFVGNITSGNYVTINAIVPVVVSGPNTDTELTGAFNPALILLSGVSGSFPVLMPGSNNIRFVKVAGTATSFSIQVDYRKSYRA